MITASFPRIVFSLNNRNSFSAWEIKTAVTNTVDGVLWRRVIKQTKDGRHPRTVWTGTYVRAYANTRTRIFVLCACTNKWGQHVYCTPASVRNSFSSQGPHAVERATFTHLLTTPHGRNVNKSSAELQTSGNVVVNKLCLWHAREFHEHLVR